MKNKTLRFFVVVTLCCFFKVSAQDNPDLQTSLIDPVLIENANAVVRSEEVIIEINSIKSVITKTRRVVTVLNKNGRKHADSYEPYNPSIKVKKLEATVYDASGKEIKKYKKKDFDDVSAYDGISLMNDNRVKYFHHTPMGYPYTLVFESELDSESTAFIESWVPILAYRVSVEKSSFKIVNPTKIELRRKESNFEGFPVESTNSNQEISYNISNVQARLKEDFAPSFHDLFPVVKVALNEFSLEGVEGSGADWKSFGQWQYDKLLSGRDELPVETVKKVSELLTNAKTNKEKAKLIYQYVQDKTRYISVQLGIGGWMPFLASDVDRLGYGDCKALTNYTKALLDSQGIPSYYAVVYGDKAKRDIDPEFASMQGNHVILNIPEENEDIWLECTSQTMPFNFIGDFTDDRNVLLVTPEGGEIKRTKKYMPEENTLHTSATIDLNANKSMMANVERVSKGLEYDWNYNIQFEDPKDQKIYYKKKWGNINNLEVKSVNLKDNKDEITFTEIIKVNSLQCLKKVGGRLLITPNLFSLDRNNLPKYENRVTDLVLPSGYVNTDEYVLNLPKGYVLSSLPEKKSIETEFGKYTYELEKITDSQIKFKRFIKIIDGTFPKEKYEEYRNFRYDIKKIDNTKIVLKQQ